MTSRASLPRAFWIQPVPPWESLAAALFNERTTMTENDCVEDQEHCAEATAMTVAKLMPRFIRRLLSNRPNLTVDEVVVEVRQKFLSAEGSDSSAAEFDRLFKETFPNDDLRACVASVMAEQR
jgi:hypothetical protein